MTRTVSAGLEAHFGQETTNLAILWKVTRVDTTVMGFTNHDRNITFDSVTYNAATGFSPSEIELKSDYSVTNQDIESILDSSAITEPDLLAGVYDYAEIEVMMINHKSIGDGVVIISRGYLGQVTVKDGSFIAEVRGLSEFINKKVGQRYSPSCRAILGDSRCGVNLASFTFSDTVDEVVSNQVFVVNSLGQDPAYFTGGQVNWTSGANNGLSMEVKDFLNGKVTLALAMPNAIAESDGFDIIAGCDKDSVTCINKFNNIVNFRGEPYVPGQDAALETAGTFSG